MFLAYARGPHENQSFPIAAICVSTSESRDSVLFVRDDWEKTVTESLQNYIKHSFQDWVRWMESNRGKLPPNILDLSIGPFRTVLDDECDEQDLIPRVEGFFEGLYRRFTLY